MKPISVRWLPIAIGGLVLGTAIAACGELADNTPDTTTQATEQTTEEPAVVAEESPTLEAEPAAEPPAEEMPESPPAEQLPRSDRGIRPSIEVGQITVDRLFDLGGGGCGMVLYGADRSQFPEAQGFLLSNGLDEASMLMKINGSVLRFQRTDFSGEPFYGQYLSQTFYNEDQGVQVSADVVLGEPGEIESVEIEAGTLEVEMDGVREEFAVVGGAGC